jgi:hypothetical protein
MTDAGNYFLLVVQVSCGMHKNEYSPKDSNNQSPLFYNSLKTPDSCTPSLYFILFISVYLFTVYLKTLPECGPCGVDKQNRKYERKVAHVQCDIYTGIIYMVKRSQTTVSGEAVSGQGMNPRTPNKDCQPIKCIEFSVLSSKTNFFLLLARQCNESGQSV